MVEVAVLGLLLLPVGILGVVSESEMRGGMAVDALRVGPEGLLRGGLGGGGGRDDEDGSEGMGTVELCSS